MIKHFPHSKRLGAYSGAARREPGAKSRRNKKDAVTCFKSSEAFEIVSAEAHTSAPQGVSQEPNLDEKAKDAVSLIESLEVSEIVIA